MLFDLLNRLVFFYGALFLFFKLKKLKLELVVLSLLAFSDFSILTTHSFSLIFYFSSSFLNSSLSLDEYFSSMPSQNMFQTKYFKVFQKRNFPNLMLLSRQNEGKITRFRARVALGRFFPVEFPFASLLIFSFFKALEKAYIIKDEVVDKVVPCVGCLLSSLFFLFELQFHFFFKGQAFWIVFIDARNFCFQSLSFFLLFFGFARAT